VIEMIDTVLQQAR